MRSHVDPHQEDELGHEEAAAQVLVDGGPGALDLSEEPEGEDAHGQTDEGDDHAQLGDPGQDDGVGPQLRSKSNGRHFSFGSFTVLLMFAISVVRFVYFSSLIFCCGYETALLETEAAYL